MASKVTKFITISIGSSEIKLSELDSSRKNISVLWAETVPTPADSYDEGEIVDIEKISRTLKQTIFKNRINAKHVIFTVHGPKFANKEIIIPNVKRIRLSRSWMRTAQSIFLLTRRSMYFHIPYLSISFRREESRCVSWW